MTEEAFNITDIQILPVKPKNGLVGFTSFVFNGLLYIGNVAIYTRPINYSIRLVYPQKTLPNGKVVSCVHPLTKEIGELIEQAVLEKYQQLVPSEL